MSRHSKISLEKSVALALGISVRDLDDAWARAELTVFVGRTHPVPPQLRYVMTAKNVPRRMRRTKKNNRAFKRMKQAQAEGRIGNIRDIMNSLPGFTKPPPNPYPTRKVGRPVPHRLIPVRNRTEGFSNKPDWSTGFWTSTYLGPKYLSAWVLWCQAEHFRWAGEYRSWVLEVDPDAYVLELDSEAAMDALVALGYTWVTDRYKDLGDDSFLRRPQIDYEKLASIGVAGVRLTERGNDAMHLMSKHDFNAWDAESTVWLRWAFTRVRVGPKIVIPEREWG